MKIAFFFCRNLVTSLRTFGLFLYGLFLFCLCGFLFVFGLYRRAIVSKRTLVSDRCGLFLAARAVVTGITWSSWLYKPHASTIISWSAW